jgi:hypothetical protein
MVAGLGNRSKDACTEIKAYRDVVVVCTLRFRASLSKIRQFQRLRVSRRLAPMYSGVILCSCLDFEL